MVTHKLETAQLPSVRCPQRATCECSGRQISFSSFSIGPPGPFYKNNLYIAEFNSHFLLSIMKHVGFSLNCNTKYTNRIYNYIYSLIYPFYMYCMAQASSGNRHIMFPLNIRPLLSIPSFYEQNNGYTTTARLLCCQRTQTDDMGRLQIRLCRKLFIRSTK